MHSRSLLRLITALIVYSLGSWGPIWASSNLEISDDTKSCTAALTGDAVDFNREWGVRLLKDDDVAFSDPEYLSALMSLARPGTVGFYSSMHQLYTPYTKLLKDFNRYFSAGDDPNSFIEVLRFTNSGTDANNVFFELAEWAFEKRTGKKAKRANLLYFEKPYGGVFGRIAEIGSRYTDTNPEQSQKFKIPTPRLRTFTAANSKELAEIEQLEDEALAFIKKQVANDELEIGGIFIEPIMAFDGVWVYRPEFMKRLRDTADELNVPIFADEILTGGGRTGKFWASHHYDYKNFEPDAISFGKGLVVSGIAGLNRTHQVGDWIVPRWKWPMWSMFSSEPVLTYPQVVLDNTSKVSPLALLQATQVLKQIREDNLIQNARDVGAYTVEKLKAKARRNNMDPYEIRGVGLLIYGGSKVDDLTEIKVKGYQGRWTPPLTLSKPEVDQIIGR